MSLSIPARSPDFVYDAHLLLWRTVTSIFFREILPRGAYHIPKDGPVILVAALHANQFFDFVPLALRGIWGDAPQSRIPNRRKEHEEKGNQDSCEIECRAFQSRELQMAQGPDQVV